MAYTLGDIRNRIMTDKLDDTSYDTAVIDRFINDAQREIANRYEIPAFEKQFSGLLPAGEFIFAFPTDYQLSQMLLLVDVAGQARDVTDNYFPFRQFFRAYPAVETAAVGLPTAWTLHGNKLYINRPTDQTYTLKLLYIKNPDLMDDIADVPEVPDEYEEALVLGALYRIQERNEDYDLAETTKGHFDEQLDILVARAAKRQIGKPNTMGQPLRVGFYGRRARS